MRFGLSEFWFARTHVLRQDIFADMRANSKKEASSLFASSLKSLCVFSELSCARQWLPLPPPRT
jgi:hypothetical protein